MQLQEMKNEYEKAKRDLNQIVSITARIGIHEEMKKLKSKIDDEERRLNSEEQVVNIDGVDYRVPTGYGFYQEDECYTYEVKDGNLYRFERMDLDSDGSFHVHHHVWIPQREDKYVDLCVRVLGGDRFGERYSLSARYYKHPSDFFSYMHKHIHPLNEKYNPMYSHVLNKMKLKKKDGYRNNELEWVNLQLNL